MTDTTIVAVPPAATSPSYVEWAPVIGGALVATALSFILFSFGSAAGVSSVSPYSWDNPSLTTLSLIAAAWFVIVMIGTFLVGGYFAGRFRRPIAELSLEERSVRDGAHGLLVWALGLILGVTIGFLTAGAAARNTAMAVGPAAATATQNAAVTPLSTITDTMLRPTQPAQGADAARGEASRLLSSAFARGEIPAGDRDYLARVVSVQAGIPEEEARRRVDTAIEQAKQAADKARKMAAILAFLIGAASLFAAGSAYWGATVGGEHRDRSARV